MLRAGAEQEKIEAAMRNYEEAMSLLRYYVSNPESDYENRRLKVAQESLARARVRASTYLKRLENSQLTEENTLELQTEQEYEEFIVDVENSVSSAFASLPSINKELSPKDHSALRKHHYR